MNKYTNDNKNTMVNENGSFQKLCKCFERTYVHHHRKGLV